MAARCIFLKHHSQILKIVELFHLIYPAIFSLSLIFVLFFKFSSPLQNKTDNGLTQAPVYSRNSASESKSSSSTLEHQRSLPDCTRLYVRLHLAQPQPLLPRPRKDHIFPNEEMAARAGLPPAERAVHVAGE